MELTMHKRLSEDSLDARHYPSCTKKGEKAWPKNLMQKAQIKVFCICNSVFLKMQKNWCSYTNQCKTLNTSKWPEVALCIWNRSCVKRFFIWTISHIRTLLREQVFHLTRIMCVVPREFNFVFCKTMACMPDGGVVIKKQGVYNALCSLSPSKGRKLNLPLYLSCEI